ncbi:MAG: metal-dependent transcriptional regulator [Phycisphaerae bacterium]|nr:metal-dependent transcriptional regulator [Phycisphaerae bacterium]
MGEMELSSTLEDYLRTIFVFQRRKRYARVSDVASALGVAKSAVTAALQGLASRHLVNYQAYEPVTLTSEGERRAEQILLRHRILCQFLEDVLAIPPERAEPMAHQMEHAIDGAALERFVCFLAFIGTRAGKGKTWLREFKQFVEKGAGSRTCRECIKQYLQEARDHLANTD